MKAIAVIAEDIREELDGAKHYAKLATQHKDTDKMLADTYYMLATQELGHVDALHAQAVRMIKAYEATGAKTPEGMQAVYDWEHKHQIDMVAHIKVLLEQYKK